MEGTSSYLVIAGDVEATRADALICILRERGRGFASDKETWAELRWSLETIKEAVKNAETVHKEMWNAVKDGNDDAFAACLQEFERAAARLAGEFIRASATAKIALEDPELPEDGEPGPSDEAEEGEK